MPRRVGSGKIPFRPEITRTAKALPAPKEGFSLPFFASAIHYNYMSRPCTPMRRKNPAVTPCPRRQPSNRIEFNKQQADYSFRRSNRSGFNHTAYSAQAYSGKSHFNKLIGIFYSQDTRRLETPYTAHPDEQTTGNGSQNLSGNRKSMTVSELCDLYGEEKTRHKKASTLAMDRKRKIRRRNQNKNAGNYPYNRIGEQRH